MATRRFPKASALNKEPYRLWFEFLKRAKARGLKVHKDYVEWGDTNMGFDRWWESHGSKMFNIVANGVDLVSEDTAHDDNYYLFAIPKHLSPRQTRDEAEKLMKRLKSEHGQIKLNARWRLADDAAPKCASIRIYIHTLDCRDKLIKQAIKEGGSAADVSVVHILAALRLYYIKKHERYGGKGDAMPYRIMHGDGGHETDPSKIVVSDHSDPKVATESINAIREYLKKGEKVLENVAQRTFP